VIEHSTQAFVLFHDFMMVHLLAGLASKRASGTFPPRAPSSASNHRLGISAAHSRYKDDPFCHLSPLARCLAMAPLKGIASVGNGKPGNARNPYFLGTTSTDGAANGMRETTQF
jgi:hypothetical protein